MPTVLSRALGALPDALTSSLFLIAWVAPGFLGATRVKDLMLTMLIEFIVMHSSAFYAGIAGMTDASRGKRLMLITALSAFYLLFVVGFSVGFASTWPIWAFGWLFVSRFAHLWTKGGGNDDAIRRNMSSWMISAMAYLGGVFATILLPLPALGLTPSAIAALHIPNNMSGLWIDKPWTVIAFGALYFAVLAWSKYRLSATQTIA
ncbi:MAG: hypothetical protein ABI846_07665 [Rudaea sp.]